MRIILALLAFFTASLLAAAEPVSQKQLAWYEGGGELQGFEVVSRSPPSLTYLGGCFVGSDATAYTCSTFNAGGNSLGAEDPDRVIYVACSSAAVAARTVSSVTIAGTTASKVADPSSNTNISVVAALALPTGASGDVVITYSGAMVTNGCGVWRGVGYSATATANLTNQTETSQNLTTAANGMAVGSAYDSATTPNWSSGLSNNETANPEAARFYAVGSATGTSSGSTAMDAAGTGFTSIAVASFAPQ